MGLRMKVPFLDLRAVYRTLRSLFWRMKSRIDQTLFVLACHGPAARIAQAILRLRNWKSLQLAELSDTMADASVTVAEPAPYAVVAPRWVGKTTLMRSGNFPAVRAHVLTGVITTAYSPAVLRADKLFLPKHVFDDRARVMTDSGGLFQMGPRFTVGRIDAEDTIEGGIHVGGAGAFNWYHFVLECLPKAFLARKLPSEFDSLPLLVPDECRRIPSFAAALALFSAGRSLRFMRRGEYALVNRLVILDEISIGPFNLALGEWPRIDDYCQHDTVMRAFIAEFRSKVLKPDACLLDRRRIFLIRPGVRRNYNQDELIEIALRYGFEPVAPESLSLQEQAKTFAEASAVVGPSGAAWVGMIFRERPLRGLCWLPRPYEQFCSYSALGSLLGHRIDFIEAQTRRALRSTDDAYTREYRVCPFAFENALKEITEVV